MNPYRHWLTALALTVSGMQAMATDAVFTSDDKLDLFRYAFIKGCMKDNRSYAQFQKTLEQFHLKLDVTAMCSCAADRLIADQEAKVKLLAIKQESDAEEPTFKRFIGAKAMAFGFNCMADQMNQQLKTPE